jgi:hypothetical protein
MSFEKIAQNVAQPMFSQSLYTTFFMEKVAQKLGLLL